MKRFFTFLILLVALQAAAQPYNNEWIDVSKTYYKFKVGATGLYRISASVLAANGMSGVPAQNFQLFRNGQEVPIYTSVASGPLGGTDYIEFWGMINDGVPDKPLYRNPSYQHTTQWSLETDTAVYFLTVNPAGSSFHSYSAANNVAGSSLTPEPWFWYTSGTYFRDGGVNPGFAQVVGEYIYSSSYDIGEWWSTPPIAPGSPYTSTQSNLFPYTGSGAPAPTLKFGAAGTADDARTIQVTVNGTPIGDTTMPSFFDAQTTWPVSMSSISGGSATVGFINNSTVTTDRMVASFYELNYPRLFNFAGRQNFSFQLPAKAAGYLLNITNFAISGSATPVLYDLTNGNRYTAVVSGSTLEFALPGSSATTSFVLVNEDPATVTNVTSLTAKTFENMAASGNQANYIIISNPVLYTDGTNDGVNPVNDYKAYRSSAAGGGFDVQVYDIHELIDQFGFGIKNDPLAIQNFLRYARTVWGVKPQYVLLIGHGLCYNSYITYGENQHNPLADQLNLVPTFGYPASDNKLATNNGVDAVPITPIGRLSVVSGAEVETYLAKVREYEQVQQTAPNTIDGRLWMKNMLHLTGVSEPYLGTILCNYMSYYASVISDTSYGANVNLLCDGNASAVTQVPGSYISSLFSTGFSVLNYFGHSSNSSLAYNLNDPTSYNNPGKYPVFYLNGCDAGDFFVYDPLRLSTNKTISESWVLAPERGAIACVAATHFGIVNYLNILLNWQYSLMSGADYNKPIGVLEKDALQDLMNSAPTDFFARQHAEQMSTNGDPFLKLNEEALPDYDIEASQVEINPSFIAVSNNSFTVNAKFYNLGRATRDSISILILRQYPNGSTTTLLKKRIPGILYADSVQLTVPIVATRDLGTNSITVTVNSDNDVTEITRANNSVTSTFVIYQNEATPTYPYNYSIINTPTSKLYASTASPLLPMQQYVMQIDTTMKFNSSLLVTKMVTSVGGELEFDPGISFMDSVVYYWRVGVAPTTPGGAYTWNTSSFVYIDPAHGGVGYNQSHYFQHTASTTTNILLDSVSRRWKFQNLLDNLFIRNTTFPVGAGASSDAGFTTAVNGGAYNVGPGCYYDEIIFNVYDSTTFRPWQNVYSGGSGLYNSLSSTCGLQRQYNFEYALSTVAGRKNAIDFLNMLPAGAFVEIRNNVNPDSASNTYVDKWQADTALYGSGNSLAAIFESAGVTVIDSFTRPRAFAAVYQKGVSSFHAVQAITNNTLDAIGLNVDCTTPDTTGSITSPVFGPAKKWSKLHWRVANVPYPHTDSTILQVFGIDTSGNKTLLYTVPSSTQDFDISSISAFQYPLVQLNLVSKDTKHGTPFQLGSWRIEDVPSPEGAIAPNILLKGADTLSIGQPLDFAIAFKNISPYSFDSMALKLDVVDASNITHPYLLPKRKPLISGDTISFDYLIDTKSLAGANTLYLNFNPNGIQPEQYLFNNFIYKPFFVKSDIRNPTLDVTFDNVHILNEDIVSARPHIQIRLESQSQYLLLTDTSLVSVQIQYPDGSVHNYKFNTDTLRFTPATGGGNNVAIVDFTPAFTTQFNPQGDVYTLIVSGKDAQGSTAGGTPYRVAFKVINKPMISNMLNYPNPFTTSTAFVFTITGSEVPQNIKIQILTITGKVVREITKEELGPLHIGTNITEYKWNGTDMYGQRLANGVYLYHVVTNLNGKSLSKYTGSGDNTDKYFNNGYGKMYLMGH
ncbi:MAG TPA: C25 family cysteine peptidase [Puia sp.]|nr:C25 family cysteine peptidase [Puia sp.]